MNRFETMQVREGRLYIGEKAASDLAEQFGTPLYVYDEGALRETAQTFVRSFKSDVFETRVIYASKAASFIALIRLAAEEGLALDVVSEGELYTAQCAGFPMARVIFHGNNKLDRELEMALAAGVGTVVLDNPQEAERLSAIATAQGKKVDVLLRVNPGIDAHTHAYIQTATTDSKFGIPILDGAAEAVFEKMAGLPGLSVRGVHCHIGSQIFSTESFEKTAVEMLKFIASLREHTGIHLDILDLGGGFGVYYTEGDEPFELSGFLQTFAAFIAREAFDRGVVLSEVWIEPGRSMVNSAGLTLYRVGDTKRLPEDVNYAFIDGGMGDNLRPALYEALYDACLVDKVEAPVEGKWRIAGKYCESGDVLIKNLPLPTPERGDVLAIFGTGAYTFSMNSDYNRLCRPAVVFVHGDQAREVVRRERLEDIVALDCRD